MGTKGSGITAHPRGWNLGVMVDGYSGNGDRDNFSVRITGGSNGSYAGRYAFEVTDLGQGWVRVATGELFGGEVFYISPSNERMTKLPNDAPSDVREG